MYVWIAFAACLLSGLANPSRGDQPKTPGQPQITQPTTRYTLQIERASELAELEKNAEYLAQNLSIRIRIVKDSNGFVIRAGESLQSNDLETYINNLHSLGFPDANIVYMQIDDENVVKIANPQAPDSVDQISDQPHLLQTQQQSPPSAARRRSDIFSSENELSKMLRLKKTGDGETRVNGDEMMQQAWDNYRHGAFDSACELFERAQADPKTEQAASSGLSRCLLQRGKYQEAIDLLNRLIGEGVNLEESQKLLVDALFKSHAYDAALKATRQLKAPEAGQWRELIAAAEVSAAFKHYEPNRPEDFLEKNRSYLDRCQAPAAFLVAARDLISVKNQTAANYIFERLLTACSRQWDVRLSAFAGLADLLPPEKMRARFDRELSLKNLPSQYRAKLSAKKLALLQAMASRLTDGIPQHAARKEALYRSILATNPGDKGALSFLAWRCFNQGDYGAAREYFSALYSDDATDKSSAEGLSMALARMGRQEEALAVAEAAGNLKLQIDHLHAFLAEYPSGSQQSLALSQRLLAIAPGDNTALSALAWWHYHHNDYSRSEALFTQLSHAERNNKDYRLGLIYSLFRQNKIDQAIEALPAQEQTEGDFQALAADLHLARANVFFQDKKYVDAETELKNLLESAPKHPEARLLLGWSLYHQQKREEALAYFQDIWRERRDPGVASVLPELYEAAGRDRELSGFISELSQSRVPALQKVLADYFAEQDSRLPGEERFDRPPRAYGNALSPSLSLAYLNRNRSGERGLAHLEQDGVRLTYRHPLADNQAFAFELTPEHVSAGGRNDLSGQPVGTSTGIIPAPPIQNRLITSADLITPTVKFETGEKIKQSYKLGTTPLNGVLEPRVTGAAKLEGRNWQVDIHQEPVVQSILSYIGLNDPYSSRSWGRVLRSGASGQYSFDLSHGYWLSLSGRSDYYWGKDVADNYGIEGSLAAGKSMKMADNTLTLGAFLANSHFDRNLNFHTFGNGGYYSPDYLFAAGPFLNFEYRASEKFRWKTGLSANWFHSETRDAAYFPTELGLSDRRFAGETKEGIGYRLAWEGRYFLSPYIDFGGRFSFEQSAAFSDMVSNIGIRLYFSPRSAPR